MSEVEGLFDFLGAIYGLFGFSFKLKLSTRPEKYMGSIETWDQAEEQLKQALTKFCGNDWSKSVSVIFPTRRLTKKSFESRRWCLLWSQD